MVRKWILRSFNLKMDPKGDEGMGDGGKMDSEGAASKNNMPESSTTSDGCNPSMGSVFDEQVGQIFQRSYETKC